MNVKRDLVINDKHVKLVFSLRKEIEDFLRERKVNPEYFFEDRWLWDEAIVKEDLVKYCIEKRKTIPDTVVLVVEYIKTGKGDVRIHINKPDKAIVRSNLSSTDMYISYALFDEKQGGYKS